MKNKNIKICTLLAITLLFNACGLLDVDTVSSISGDGYWKTKGDAESYLVGVYTSLRDVVNSNGLTNFEDRGDAFDFGLIGGPSNQWAQNLTSQNGYGWGGYYTVIQHCNMLIKNIESIHFGVEADKNAILAETYFIRSYMYFNVLRIWGDAPIELEPTENASKPKLGRSPASEVLQQALDDVNKSLELFPNESYSKGKGRVSKPASHALKADILLWRAKVLDGTNKDYEDVIANAELASKGLFLEEDFANIYGTKKGKEVIFALHFEMYEKSGHYSSKLKPRDVFVEKAVNKADIAYAKSGASPNYAPSDELMSLFEKNPSDDRIKKSYIKGVDPDGNLIGVFDNKMRGTKTEGDRSFDSDIIIYRLAEMYLFKAEAFAALGKMPEAVAELNKVRNRAKIGNYAGAMDKLSVEKEILDERGRELYLELKRWPDLLRFHYSKTIDVYDIVPNLRKKLEQGIRVPLYLAIPLRDLDINSNLEQTKGYENL